MALPRGLTYAVLLTAVLATGCSGMRTYPNGINHCYLCAVKIARLNGYQIREQDFHPKAGDLVAARSVPDPKETKVSRGFFRRAWEVLWNLWEHGKFELWDEDLAAARVKTEERFTVSFTSRVSGPLGWLGVSRPRETRIKVELDVSDYGREDWVMARKKLKPADHERVYKEIKDCLAYASPTAYLTATKKARVAVETAASQPTAVSAALAQPTAQPVAGTPQASAIGATTTVESAASPSSATAAESSTPKPPTATSMSAEAIASLLSRGRGSYDAGKYEEAIPLLEQVIAADPESAEAFGYLGAAYYQRKRLDDAIRAYEVYVKLVPSDTRTQAFLGEIRKEKSQPR
ncbi:MAG: tetratricopeptide repeat protein [Candidatus Coatesbacteria bacterium]